MRKHDFITAEVIHRYVMSPEDVFDAWLSTGIVRRWLAASLEESTPGTELLSVEIDPRVGGEFRFIDSRDPDQSRPTGTYLKIERPRRLTFTWLPEDGEHSVVMIDIKPDGDGSVMTLVHEMDPAWQDYLARTQAAWERMAQQIDNALRA